ncbi:MAG: hypothetical protein EOO89_19025 [Pedobacter sp.]|nr:MAG: hypothetical protein EOO89_19025 [Pedobacter sp.]
MSYNILATRRFEKEIKRLSKKFPSLRNEFFALIELLNSNPETGTSLGNNCYKIRMSIASKGKGKSGGARVLTYLYLEANTIYLLSIYDKSEKESISDKEIMEIIQTINL